MVAKDHMKRRLDKSILADFFCPADKHVTSIRTDCSANSEFAP